MTKSIIPEPCCERPGDSTLLFSWPQLDEQSTEVTVLAAHHCLAACTDSAIRGLVPGWSSLAVHFSPLEVAADVLEQRLRLRLQQPIETARVAPRIMQIPVSFLPEHSLDLPHVADSCRMTVEDCIELLTATVFRVRMIGFSPGFPYLSGLPEALRLPRRATPRLAVPAGSVAIAGGLAGIYPQRSPGGWHLVGHTSVRLFDPAQTPACLLQPGDEVRLVPLDRPLTTAMPGDT
ncbi:MAG: 5-oxoprolinase subunit PxpB [Planctomycetota bacterium]